MKKVIIMFILLISAIFVVNKYWDESYLGDDYYFMSIYEAIDVGSPFGAIVYKSKRKNSYSIEDIKIPENVLRAESRGNYIIAIQKSKNEIVERYFIVDKKNDNVFKNLSKKEFENLCLKLEIKRFEH